MLRHTNTNGLKRLGCGLHQRVHVPNNYVLGFWVIGISVLVLGKYLIIRYLDLDP